jgi:predicted ATP-dependent serine protease
VLSVDLRRVARPDSVVSQLRGTTGTEIDQRLDDMRRTAGDITLKYRRSGDGEKTDLAGLVDVLFTQPGRVILTGQPGVGKSYTALQVAAAVIRRDKE